MNIQSRFIASNFDLHLRPLAGNEVHIALIFLWELLPQSLPGEVRERNILGRMVTPRLIVGASVGGAKVEAFILCGVFCILGRDAESHPYKSSRPFSRVG